MSLESCKWVQPFPRARERLAPRAVQYGQRGRWSNWPDKARFQPKNPGRAVSGRDLIAGDVRSVGADVHGAQAHAAAGFDPALLQAAVHLAKHRKYSPVDWREAVVSSLPISRSGAAMRSRASGRIVFQECFVGRDWRTSFRS